LEDHVIERVDELYEEVYKVADQKAD